MLEQVPVEPLAKAWRAEQCSSENPKQVPKRSEEQVMNEVIKANMFCKRSGSKGHQFLIVEASQILKDLNLKEA